MTRRITAIELDDALDRITAAIARLSPEQRAELLADMPPDIMAVVDQAGAAQAQSVAWRELDAKGGDRVGWFPKDSVDDWIRLGALDTVAGWITGTGRTCMHAPTHLRPQPVFSAAWRPNLVVCAQCLHLLAAVGAADRICDCCGHECLGVDAGDPVYGGTVFIGELAYEFGTCTGCRPALGNEGVA